MSAGVLNQVSFKRETVWGTPVVPDKSIPVRFTGGIQTQQDIQLLSSVTARIPKNYEAMVGNRTHEGNYEFDHFVDHIGFFLLSAMGNVASLVAGGETIVFNHTFSEVETKPSLTIEQVVGENIRRFAGSIVTVITFSGEAGAVSSVAASIKSKSQASAVAITPVYTAIRPFNFADAKIKIGGITLTEVQNYQIEFNNNVELLHTLNSNDPQFRFIKGSEVSGTIEMFLDTATLVELNNYLTKNEREIILELTGGSIGVASFNKMVLTIPRAVLTTADTEISEDHNMLTIEFQGLFDTVSSKMISVVLTNLLANYN